MNPRPTNISQQDFELIECYLTNSLNEKEKIDFEARIKKDPILKKQLEEQELLVEAIEEQTLVAKLNDFHSEVSSKVISINKNKEKPDFYRKLAIAATIAILFGLGGFWLTNQPTSNEKIFATYFNPDPGLQTTMGATTQFEFLDAMVDYKQGNYTKAIRKWEPLLNYNPQNDSLNYFIGVAHLAKGEEQPAIQYLKIVSENQTSIFNKDAYFYLGLAYIKTGNFELAKKYLSFSETKISKQIIADLDN